MQDRGKAVDNVITVERIISTPDLIKQKKLYDNGSIASDWAINYISSMINGQNDGHYSKDKQNKLIRAEDLKNGVKTKFLLEHDFIIFNGDGYVISDIVIGEGKYGEVRYLQNIKTKEWLALKICDDINEEYIEKEIDILQAVTNFGGYVTKELNQYVKKKVNGIIKDVFVKTRSYLLMPLVNGVEMQQVIEEMAEELKRGLSKSIPVHLLKIVESLAVDLNKLHKAGIVHRDLKPENFLISRKAPLGKIVDFGFAAYRKTDEDVEYNNEDILGTPGFQAPEILDDFPEGIAQEKFTPKSDGYAFGVAMAEYYMMDFRYTKTLRNQRKFKAFELLDDDSEDLTPFAMLIPDPKARLELVKIVKALTHPEVDKRLHPAKIPALLKPIYARFDYSYVMDKMVGVLDIREFLTVLQDKSSGATLLKALKEFDQIVLVADAKDNVSLKDIYAVYDILQKKGIDCSDQCYRYHGTKESQSHLLQQLQQMLNQQDQLHYYNCCQISHSNKFKNFTKNEPERMIYTISNHHAHLYYQQRIRNSYFPKTASEEDKDKVRAALRNEIKRIDRQHKDNKKERHAHIHLIKKSIAGLQQPMNYGQLREMLEKLSLDVSNVRRYTYLPVFFQRKSQTVHVIKKLVDDVLPIERPQVYKF